MNNRTMGSQIRRTLTRLGWSRDVTYFIPYYKFYVFVYCQVLPKILTSRDLNLVRLKIIGPQTYNMKLILLHRKKKQKY